MTTTTLTPVETTVIASTSNAAGANKRGAVDMRGAFGGLLSCSIKNGATGPTVACGVIVSVSHDDGSTPATAADGISSTWKRLYAFAHTTTASEEYTWTLDVPPCSHVQIEFSGNTGEAVTVEAVMTVYSAAESV